MTVTLIKKNNKTYMHLNIKKAKYAFTRLLKHFKTCKIHIQSNVKFNK